MLRYKRNFKIPLWPNKHLFSIFLTLNVTPLAPMTFYSFVGCLISYTNISAIVRTFRVYRIWETFEKRSSLQQLLSFQLIYHFIAFTSIIKEEKCFQQNSQIAIHLRCSVFFIQILFTVFLPLMDSLQHLFLNC